MPQRTKDVLKTWFETGDKPTEEQFSDLIDSFQPSIQNNELASLESNTDGSMYFDQIGLIVDIGSGEYDPFTAQENFEYDIQIDGLWTFLEKAASAPFILQYAASKGGTRQCSAYVMYNAASIQIRGIMRADFGEHTCCLATATVSPEKVHVKFEVGYFGNNFGKQDVLDTILEGLVLSPNEAVTAKDSILVAIGKLQAQITAILEAEPDRYISVAPQVVTIPADGTAQTVQVTTNEDGEWTAAEQ